jgi:hypothetical protein
MPREPVGTLEGNCAAISAASPELAAAIRASAPDESFSVGRSRTGLAVPLVRRGTGTIALHSLYDPVREAERLAASVGGAGCYVCIGLGAGYQAAALLREQGACSVLIVENDLRTLNALLRLVDLRAILADPRTSLVLGAEALRTALPSVWQPSLMGGLRSVPLRPWCQCQPAFFQAAADNVQAAVEAVRADYGVQAHFGKRWASNVLGNLARAEAPAPTLPRARSALVTAAGPSLEAQIPQIARLRRTATLVATDTSLPALLGAGLLPDLILSIDCQNHGYLHFMKGLPERSTLVLDIASPPLLARLAARHGAGCLFAASGHPLAAYLGAHWKAFPSIDMSGGNVASAAVCLARSLGADEVRLFGADFAYPIGKSYARGTYLYDLFGDAQDRRFPLESRFYSFLHRTADLRREESESGVTYTTPVLSSYRERLEAFVRVTGAHAAASRGEGLCISWPRAEPQSPGFTRGSAAAAAGPPIDWRIFLGRYASSIAALAPLTDPPGRSFMSLPMIQRELWGTLLPLAARVLAESGEPAPTAAVFETSRAWLLQRVERAIASCQRSQG